MKFRPVKYKCYTVYACVHCYSRYTLLVQAMHASCGCLLARVYPVVHCCTTSHVKEWVVELIHVLCIIFCLLCVL